MTKKTAKPKRAVIPAGTKSIEAAYDILARDLALPAHFGRNLDALYDALAGDVEGPFEIVVEDPKSLAAALGGKGEAFLRLFHDLAKARRDATVVLGRSPRAR